MKTTKCHSEIKSKNRGFRIFDFKIRNHNSLILICFFTCCLLSVATSAQSPSCIWAKSAGGSGIDYANSIAADASGNVYVAGGFASSTILFGAATLTNAGFNDMFLVKYDANGNVIWAVSAGGNSDDRATSVAVDASGNVCVAGYFSSSAITFGAATLTNAGAYDVFLVKYDASGNTLWAKNTGGNSDDRATSVAVDASGNVCVTGYFKSSSITFGTTALNNAGAYDMFILKYDSIGNALWAKSAGGSSSELANSVVADRYGNIYAAGGFFSSSITFGSITLNNAAIFSDMFIVKYDESGNVLWAKRAGGNNFDDAYSLAADSSGNIYAAGGFYSPVITFGSTMLNNANAGIIDVFVVKYDASGNALWAKRAGGSDADGAVCLTTDASGNVCVTGYFKSSSIIFGSATLSNSGTGNNDMFLVKYDASGNVIWAKSAGGAGSDFAYSLAVDALGDMYVAGGFTSTSITFGSTTLTNAGADDMFIAKLSGVTGMEELQNGNAIVVYPNPSSGMFTVQYLMADGSTFHPAGGYPLNEPINHQPLTIEVYTVLGEKVYLTIINSQSSTLNLNVPAGVYFIQLISEGNMVGTEKLIVEKL